MTPSGSIRSLIGLRFKKTCPKLTLSPAFQAELCRMASGQDTGVLRDTVCIHKERLSAKSNFPIYRLAFDAWFMVYSRFVESALCTRLPQLRCALNVNSRCRGRDRDNSTPKEQPPRKLSGKRTTTNTTSGERLLFGVRRRDSFLRQTNRRGALNYRIVNRCRRSLPVCSCPPFWRLTDIYTNNRCAGRIY